jgi:hypothetical protein
VRDLSSGFSDLAIERIAQAFVDAFTRRDRADWIAVFHPHVEFRPTLLIGSRSVYSGHGGVGAYLDQLQGDGHAQQARVRDLRRIARDQFVLLTDVLVDGEVVSPGAVLITLKDDKIIAATAYLSDDETLASLDIIPEQAE